ncbi:MAG: sigma-70 family RNA polymerase sigma factor [Chloroflexota bacterium]
MMTQDTNTTTPVMQARWINQAKEGDQAALASLLESYRSAIYKVCYQLLQNQEDAEDATQETFLRAYRKLHTYQDRYAFSTWLFRIARNYCLDQLKRARFSNVSWDDLPEAYYPRDETQQPEKIIIAAETTLTLRTLVEALPENYNEVVTRRYWQKASCQEIAQSLGTTVSTVKGRLFRARKHMHARYSA